jgi:hypothetical protein
MGASLLLAGKSHVREQSKELEATQGARAALDTMLRELRLGGACLPITGEFISLSGVDAGGSDEITVRSGTTSTDLSCIRAATTQAVVAGDTLLKIDDIVGFEADMQIYLRHPDGTGEYHTITSVDTGNSELQIAATIGASYPNTSGVYSITERRFFLGATIVDGYSSPELLLQVDGGTAHSFAIGIESMNFIYTLNNGSTISLPANDAEWAAVDQVTVSLTSRSLLPDPDGTYYRRTMTVTVKPRNLIES